MRSFILWKIRGGGLCLVVAFMTAGVSAQVSVPEEAALVAGQEMPKLPEAWTTPAMVQWMGLAQSAEYWQLAPEARDQIRNELEAALLADLTWLDQDDGEERRHGVAFLDGLKFSLSVEFCRLLADELLARYTDPAWLEGLGFEEHVMYRDIVHRGAEQPTRLHRIRLDLLLVDHSDRWKSFLPGELASMLYTGWMVIEGEADTPEIVRARSVLAQHARDAFLMNQDYLLAPACDMEGVGYLASGVAILYPKPERVDVGLALHGFWSSLPATKVTGRDLMYMRVGLLSYFVGADLSAPPSLTANWVLNSDGWRSGPPGDLYFAMQNLELAAFGDRHAAGYQDIEKAKTELARHIYASYLSPASDWGGLGPDDIMLLAPTIGDQLSQEQAADIKKRFVARYLAEDDQLRDLPLATARSYANGLATLSKESPNAQELIARRELLGREWEGRGLLPAIKMLRLSDAGQSSSLDELRRQLIPWIQSHPEWANLSPQESLAMLTQLRPITPADDEEPPGDFTLALRQQLADRVMRGQTLEATRVRLSNVEHLQALSRDASEKGRQEVLFWALDSARNRNEWITWNFEEAVPIAIKLHDLIQEAAGERWPEHEALVQEVLVDAILTDPTHLPPAIVLTNRPSFHHGYPSLWAQGRPIAALLSNASIVDLRKRVLERDSPRPLAVMVLSNLSRSGSAEDRRSLGAYFEEKAADAASGDFQAQWLMARAYLAEAETFPTRSVLRGKRFLDRALAVADSDEVKRDVVRWLAKGQAALGEPGLARSILAQHRELYPEGLLEEYQAVLDQVALAQEGRRVWVERQVSYEADQRKLELERRLERAREAGDQSRIERYERLLQQFD
ncbi:MAG: hypothetical protein AAGC72_08085 [Planctomycetota bacterium]